MTEYNLRMWAIEQVIKNLGGVHRPSEEIVGRAKMLEAYVKGHDDPAPDIAKAA